MHKTKELVSSIFITMGYRGSQWQVKLEVRCLDTYVESFPSRLAPLHNKQ